MALITKAIRDKKNNALKEMNVDGTSHVEITQEGNMSYPEQIMAKAEEVFDLDKIKQLHDQEKDAECGKEGTMQVQELFKNIERLTAHHDRDVVILLMLAGDVLNKLKELLSVKNFSKFKKDFGKSKRRWLEQASQLAKHREDIKDITSCGKNRCLELLRLLKDTDKTYAELAKKHKFPDTSKDPEGTKLKKLIDAMIIEQRLENAKIDFATFKDAKSIAEFNPRSITVIQAKELKEKLLSHSTKESEQKELLGEMIKNKKLDFKDRLTQPPPGITDAAGFKTTLETITQSKPFTDKKWVKSQKGISDAKAFQKKLKEFLALAEELKNSIK
jgi:hypothetical protein